jgi:hypothetical protein
MTPAIIIKNAQMDGVSLALSATATLGDTGVTLCRVAHMTMVSKEIRGPPSA